MRNEIDLAEIAPVIIDDVAHELMSDRSTFHETDIEVRFGNRGSFCVNKRTGHILRIMRPIHIGGGVLAMIVHLCNFERRIASDGIGWRKTDSLDGTFTRTREYHRPIARRIRATYQQRP